MKFTKPIIIGLEIHVELDTETKLFCSCPTQGKEEPNTRTCPVCLGMPGSKPVVNKKAIDYSIMLASALNCRLSRKIVFSRKSYFYPDMAKNYQITQYEMPLGEDGHLEVLGRKINIKRVHIEEDPASLIHPGGIDKAQYVLVDYNRSGNPLCEIVTEPELESPQEAREFMRQLILVLQYLGISEPGKNIIKADANISIKESGYIRSEVKNISGFREIERALEYEILRQRQMVDEGHKLKQETRAWDSGKGVTSHLRTKETEEDYGYIFDPDLVDFEITKKYSDSLRSGMPELPHEKKSRYVKDLKISEEDSVVLTGEYKLTQIFEEAIRKVSPALAAKWIRRELVRVINYNKLDISDLKINVKELIVLLELIDKNRITDKIGQKLVEKLIAEDIDVKKYIKEHNMEGVSGSTDIEKYCAEAIAENPKAADDYRSGKELALNFLLGSVMRKSRGKADPNEVKAALIRLL